MNSITTLFDRFSASENLSTSYIGRLAAKDGKIYSRLSRGGDVTVNTYRRITQWFADRWPETAAWPADIPRPPPSPGSPAALAAAEADAAENDNNENRYCHLNARGEIADPRAFVASVTEASSSRLDGDMKIYRYVVSHYRDGAGGGGPRRHSVAELILKALVEAGDARFAERKRLLDMGREMFRGAA